MSTRNSNRPTRRERRVAAGVIERHAAGCETSRRVKGACTCQVAYRVTV